MSFIEALNLSDESYSFNPFPLIKLTCYIPLYVFLRQRIAYLLT